MELGDCQARSGADAAALDSPVQMHETKLKRIEFVVK